MSENESHQLYRCLKPRPCLSPYLLELPFYDRRAITRYICRCNYLPTSSFQRFYDPDFRPTCFICEEEIGDEVHLLLRCPYFERHRRRLPEIFANLPDGDDLERFVNILHTDDIELLRKLAQLLGTILDVCEFDATIDRYAAVLVYN